MAKQSDEIFLVVSPHKKILLPHMVDIAIGREIVSSANLSLSRRQLLLTADVLRNKVTVVNTGHNPIKIVKADRKMALHSRESSVLGFCDALELPGNHNLCFSTNKNRYQSLLRRFGQIDLNINKGGPWMEFAVGGILVYVQGNAGVGSLRSKIAAFDMDGTLIMTKSGRVFATDENDWQFLSPEVPGKLKELVSEGYSIVIFTNQAGIGGGSTNKKAFKIKVEAVVAALKVPIQVWVSTRKDFFRKPQPGMLYSCLELNGIQLNQSESFFAGDAAGRPVGWMKGKKKDFSSADIQFASNVGLRFVTPEQLFFGNQPIGITPGWKPSLQDRKDGPTVMPASGSEVIVMVGSPASGKSHFAAGLKGSGYEVICRDDVGSWQKCITMLKIVLDQRGKAVIDCTNPDPSSRTRYTSEANSYGIPARCIVMDVSKEHCLHNNAFRRLTDQNHTVVPETIIHSFWKNYVPPTLREGFKEIIKIPLNPKFDDPDHEYLYNMYLTF